MYKQFKRVYRVFRCSNNDNDTAISISTTTDDNLNDNRFYQSRQCYIN